MTLRPGIWRQWQRRDFAVALASTGDPQQAVASVQRTLFEAHALRRTSAEFAIAWDQAMAIVWEQLENRALARLLNGIEPVDASEKPAGDTTKAAAEPGARPESKADARVESKARARAPLDSRLALALLQRRKPPSGQRVVPDSRKVAAIRAELRTPSPVHLRLFQNGDDVQARWVRRSHGGFGWTDHAEAPLAEAEERYGLEIRLDGRLVRQLETVQPEALYTAAERAADGGGAVVTMTVVQISAAVGPGDPATARL